MRSTTRCGRLRPSRSPTCRLRRTRFCTRSARCSGGMFTASKGKALLTTTTGALPRPSWYTANLRGVPLSHGLSQAAYREQHFDCLACNVAAQHRAGIDIFVDGDARLDDDVALLGELRHRAHRRHRQAARRGAAAKLHGAYYKMVA